MQISAPYIRSTFLAKCPKSLLKFLLCFSIGLSIWFFPTPEKISSEGWSVFSVFMFTLSAMILRPMPLGSITLMSLLILIITKVLTFQEAFSGFSQPVVWLIAAAFFYCTGICENWIGLASFL